MALTRDFAATIRARAKSADFRRALLREAIERLFADDRTVLRRYINATIGFEPLAVATGIPAKSLMRMVSPTGNPLARNLFQVIAALERAEGVEVSVALTTFAGAKRRTKGAA